MKNHHRGDADLAASRREFLARAGAAAAGFLGFDSLAAAAAAVDLPFANGHREIVSDFPQKGAMILQRTDPPMLETPFEVFDQGVFTPNERFYVRWHLANVPTDIDARRFRLQVRGEVARPLSLSMRELMRDFEPFEIAAVNQCSGNSRGLFAPRITGGQWANGAMGNALWRGVRLKDVLDRAGVTGSAVQVRFRGLDSGLLPKTPDFLKSLDLDHCRNGEVMIAYAMNGAALPLLNGFPLRLVVPGWFATYWVKMLSDVEVLAKNDDNFWMRKAYLVPSTPGANIVPGQQGVKMVPISRMLPRSFVTNIQSGRKIALGKRVLLRGIAFGGDTGVAQVLVSTDAGTSWQEAALGANHGKYSFRQWQLPVQFNSAGAQEVRVKAVNYRGEAQPDKPNWNGGGYMRNVIESTAVLVA